MYPACMNWDKNFLASLDDSSISASRITNANYSASLVGSGAEDVYMRTSPISPKQFSPRSASIVATSSISSQTATATHWDGPAWAINLPYNVPDDDFIHKAAAAVVADGTDNADVDNESAMEMRKRLAREIRVAMKRRMFGKFIGLRGMDTPMEEVSMKLKFLEARFWQLVALDRIADASPQKVA